MKSCPKCGSYVPDGKILCVVCGRLNVGLSKNMRASAQAEKRQANARIQTGHPEKKRNAATRNPVNNPYAGGTYEQRKSYAPNGEDYYKLKRDGKIGEQELSKRIICAAAYFGFFFFLPLAAFPSSKEAKFHANQGLVLFLFGVVLGAIASASEIVLGGVFSVLNIMHPLLMVYGAYNAFQGKMVELPVIGKLRILKNYTDF